MFRPSFTPNKIGDTVKLLQLHFTFSEVLYLSQYHIASEYSKTLSAYKIIEPTYSHAFGRTQNKMQIETFSCRDYGI
jgi:hypothetical protein